MIVDAHASVVEAHQVAVAAEHELRHAVPHLRLAMVHADPQPEEGIDYHAALASHHHR